MTAISQDFKALGLPRQRPLVLTAQAIALVFILAAIFAPLAAPYDPNQVSLRSRLQPPSSTFLLGTDPLGRDVLSRMIWGARIPFYAALVAVGIGAIVGPMIALISASVSGKANSIIQRLMDLVSAFPMLILAILLITPLLLSAIAITGVGVVQFTACAGLALATVPMASCYRVARRAISATERAMPLLRTLSLAVGRGAVLVPPKPCTDHAYGYADRISANVLWIWCASPQPVLGRFPLWCCTSLHTHSPMAGLVTKNRHRLSGRRFRAGKLWIARYVGALG